MRLRPGTIVASLLLVVVGFFVIYPLFMVVYGSFMGGAGPGDPATFSLQGYKIAFGDWDTWQVLWTTIWLGTARALLSVGMGVFLAWVVTRTNTPLRKTMEVLIWLQFFCPYMPMTMSWTLLGAPNVGFLNLFFAWLLPIDKGFIDIYSYWGIIWVSSAHWASVAFFIITPAFRGMDASLEESARMCGASKRQTVRHITVPLLLPSIVGALMICVVHLMESFEVELLLGYHKGIYVYTTKLYSLLTVSPPSYNIAMPLTTMFLGMLFVLIFIQQGVFAGKQREYVTVTGRGFATRPTDLRGWKYLTLALTVAYIFFSTLLPLGILVMSTFMKIAGVFIKDPFTLKQWKIMFADPRLFTSIKNTLLLAGGAATVGMILYFFISYIVIRSKFALRRVLDFVSWLPWAIPGLLLALCFLWAYVGGIGKLINQYLGVVIYGSMGLLILAMIVKGLPLGVRAMNGAMIQLGSELEESARVLGASWFHSVRRIVAPLIAPGFISAWLLLFSMASRNLSTVVLLYSPKTRPLSVLSFEYWVAGTKGPSLVSALIMTVMILVISVIGVYVRTLKEIPTGSK